MCINMSVIHTLVAKLRAQGQHETREGKKTLSTAKVLCFRSFFYLITGAARSYKSVKLRMNPSWLGIIYSKSITK
jgi:hypothetical protein